MKIASLPTVESFKLETDPEGKAEVTIAQATFGQDREREELFKKQSYVFDDDARGRTEWRQDFNRKDLVLLEIYLTLTDAVGITDEDEKDFFDFDNRPVGIRRVKSRNKFLEQISKMPSEVVEELHRCVLKVNPQWDRAGTAEGE